MNRLRAIFASIIDVLLVIGLAVSALAITGLLNAAFWVFGRMVAEMLGWA